MRGTGSGSSIGSGTGFIRCIGLICRARGLFGNIRLTVRGTGVIGDAGIIRGSGLFFFGRIGEFIQHTPVFDGKVDRDIAICLAVPHRVADNLHIFIKCRDLRGERAVRAHMGRGIEPVASAGGIVGHPVPDYMVHAVGEKGVGYHFQIG